jgi:hypothetical protein
MLGKDIQIGQCYHAKVSGKIQVVKITAKREHWTPRQGMRDYWTAINTATGREIKIISAQRIRCRAAEPGSEGPKSMSDLFRL